ncbi:MAG: lysine exporter LysO family protein [bacterium]|nr:lysine exporter LysO family protein [bacterium]
MLLIITSLILGMFIGYFHLLSNKVMRLTKPVSLIGLFSLIFLLGVKVGNEPRVTQHLGEIGVQGLAIASSVVIGTLLFAIPIELWLRKKIIVSTSLFPSPRENRELQITGLILFSMASGIIVGYSRILPQMMLTRLDDLSWWLLAFLLLLVGIDMGMTAIWKKISQIGLHILILPLGVIGGTMLGAIMVGVMLQMQMNEVASVAGAFGWYTLSAIVLDKLHSPQLGALAFFANVLRELIAFIFIPVFVRLHRPISGIAIGGATTMDTTLVLIDRVAGAEYAALAFVQGLVLSVLVPFLVPLLVKGGI